MASCLTSESKGRFLVNNILFGSAWCLVTAQIQFSVIKNKDWTSRTLANPHSLSTITSHFCLNTPLHLPPPSKWTPYVYHFLAVHPFLELRQGRSFEFMLVHISISLIYAKISLTSFIICNARCLMYVLILLCVLIQTCQFSNRPPF